MSELHIEAVGDGEPLVLIHGWALHGGVFAPLVERLSSRFRCHLVDLPGHGFSRDAGVPLELNPVVEQIAQRTPPATWIGWSLGGLFALKAAAVQAQNVKKLVLLASTPRIVKADDWPGGIDDAVLRQLAQDLHARYRDTVERFFALDVMGNDEAAAVMRALKPGLFARGEPTPAAIDAGLRLLERADLRTPLATLPQPSLWIAGARDKLASPQAMQAAAASNPRASFEALQHAGHAPFIGQADAVAARIAAFAHES